MTSHPALAAALAIGFGLAAGPALAQPMPPGPGPGPGQQGPMAGGPGGPSGGMMGPGMMRKMQEMHHREHGPRSDPAAHFRLRRGDSEVDIHCALQESMQACVAAASALIDKLQSAQQQQQAQPAR
ncbi:MAG: hypothetical protein QJR07_05890 [Acetobacteraceae bacterium]|nr:hypothetical protein [Acetobacteraceae bacterium]